MPRRERTPIGLALARTAKDVSRAFDRALDEAGGSRPEWLVLMTLMGRPVSSQVELAEAVGVRGATLSHHLDRLESKALLTRRRDPSNRRLHLVELTEAGRARFFELRQAAQAHDETLRDGMAADDVERLRDLLGRLSANVSPRTPR